MYTNNQDFSQETANFEFAIANANRLRPAFVVVTGDLVNKPADAQQLAEYKRIAKQKLDSTIPLYSVPGNHDVGRKHALRGLAQSLPPKYRLRAVTAPFTAADWKALC